MNSAAIKEEKKNAMVLGGSGERGHPAGDQGLPERQEKNKNQTIPESSAGNDPGGIIMG